MKDIFIERSITSNLRHDNDAQLPSVQITFFGIETPAYLGNKLAVFVTRYNQSNALSTFRARIRHWNGDRCNCRLGRQIYPKGGVSTLVIFQFFILQLLPLYI